MRLKYIKQTALENNENENEHFLLEARR